MAPARTPSTRPRRLRACRSSVNRSCRSRSSSASWNVERDVRHESERRGQPRHGTTPSRTAEASNEITAASRVAPRKSIPSSSILQSRTCAGALVQHGHGHRPTRNLLCSVACLSCFQQERGLDETFVRLTGATGTPFDSVRLWMGGRSSSACRTHLRRLRSIPVLRLPDRQCHGEERAGEPRATESSFRPPARRRARRADPGACIACAADCTSAGLERG